MADRQRCKSKQLFDSYGYLLLELVVTKSAQGRRAAGPGSCVRPRATPPSHSDAIRPAPPMSPSSTTPATSPLLDTLRGFPDGFGGVGLHHPRSGLLASRGRAGEMRSYVPPHSTTQSDPAHRRVNGSSPRRHGRHGRRSQARRPLLPRCRWRSPRPSSRTSTPTSAASRHQSCRCVSSPSASRWPRTASSVPSPTLTTRVP